MARVGPQSHKKILAEFIETIIVLPVSCVKDRRYVTKVTKITGNEVPSSSRERIQWSIHNTCYC